MLRHATFSPPSRHSRALTGWTTPSAFQLDPAYIDDEPDFDLLDTHFYSAGNYFILHSLDYYLMYQNSIRLQSYTTDRLNFGLLLTRSWMSWDGKSVPTPVTYQNIHFGAFPLVTSQAKWTNLPYLRGFTTIFAQKNQTASTYSQSSTGGSETSSTFHTIFNASI